jgi:membrane associated rhomboid family serine protease
MKIQYNAPVILSFTIVSILVLFISNNLTNAFMQFFTVYPSMNPVDPADYFRLFSHAIGHSDWNHLLGNFSFILLLGPILEEKYGSLRLLIMMLLTAMITGIINIMFFSTGLLGASGIVFMLILLSSVVNLQKGKIPMTFILVVLLFLGREVVNIFREDNISQFAHIIGGICGAFFGFNEGHKSVSEEKSELTGFS